jgi:hypothetical protein
MSRSIRHSSQSLTPTQQLFPPAKAIFAGIAILLAVRFFLQPYYAYIFDSSESLLQSIKDISASYEALVEVFESIEGLLSRLDIYIKSPPTPIMTEIIAKIMVELLSTLAVVTKQIMQGRPSEFTLAYDALPS